MMPLARSRLFEPNQMQQFFDALAHFLRRAMTHSQSEGHVLKHRHVPKQGVVLKHEPDVAIAGRAVRHVLAVILDGARVGPIEPGDHAQ